MPPRVVVLTTYFKPIIGGVESSAERLARFLVRSGIDAQVVTKRISPELPDREQMDGVPIERIGRLGDRDPRGKWWLVPSAARWLVAHRAGHDVVCCIDYRGIGMAALIARRLTGHPVVFQAQTTGVLSAGNVDDTLRGVGVDPGAWLGQRVKSIVTRLYAGADAFACISRDIEQETLAAGVAPDRIHFLPNPVDMTHFRPTDDAARCRVRAQYGVADDRVIVAFAGRLSREKGLMDLLEAWRQLAVSGAAAPRDGPGPLLLVAGPDMPGHAWNLGELARAFVREHALQESVRFLGPLADVAPLYQAADVAVVPSHFEALGLSALEALACGTPVVASSAGGLLDFMIDGVNGALCPPQSPAALAGRLGPLLTDAALRHRLAVNARPSVEQSYDESVVLSRFATLLASLARRRTD
jgi:glycosyltransferase involved in cell wall biosynthesis